MLKCFSKEIIKKIITVVVEIIAAEWFNKGRDYVKTKRKKPKSGESRK